MASNWQRYLALSLAVMLLPSSLHAQVARGDERLLEPADYGQFETLSRPTLSPGGDYVAVSISRVDGTRRLDLYNLDSPAEPLATVEQARDPVFSDDSDWLVYAVVPNEREAEKLRKEEKPVRHRAELLRLPDGEVFDLGEASEVAFGGGGAFLSIYGYPPEPAVDAEADAEDDDQRQAADLIVRELSSAKSAVFGHVVEHAWQEEGPLLALVVEALGAPHAVQLYDPSDGRLRVLASGSEPYVGLGWRKDSADLAVLRAKPHEPDEGDEEPEHDVLAWKRLDADPVEHVFRHTDIEGFPEGMRVVEHRAPIWSKDGERLFFGMAPRHDKPEKQSPESGDEEDEEAEEPEEPEEPADVEVWHSFDERIIAMQRVEKQQDRKKNLLASWVLSTERFVPIGTDVDEHVELVEGQHHAVETDRAAYRFDNMFDTAKNDLVLVDATTGARKSVATGVRYGFEGSATGRYLLYFDSGHYLAYDIEDDTTRNLTQDLGASFVNDEYDTPVRDSKPPWGSGGWSLGDERVLLYDRYDIWSVSPRGEGAVRLTDGEKGEVRHRALQLDDEAAGFDLSLPIYVSLYGEWTKNSGFGRVQIHLSGNGSPERLTFRDAGFRMLTKARDAAVFAFVTQRADVSPAVFVSEDASLGEARALMETNSFQDEFLWTRGELVDYESAWGKKLQGALYYPAGFEPGKTYPMIVYVYERLSQNLHRYNVPDETRYYNPAVWTDEGYFVFNPDIAYRDRRPGPSAVDCVVPGVEAVLALGHVDRDRIGLVGHSWGGYEASFIPTQTKLFAAAVAGAPLTNFFSMFGTIHWRGGYPETSHFETGQARMEVPYWEDLEAYVLNSPVMFVPGLEAPMLVFFGDEDGTVDFHQGIELYNYARRAGKHLVMLVYRGEAHGARKRRNQIDYHRRILQWFGHFLKGEPAASWVTTGQTLLDRERETSSKKP